jgi:hypothetical protein
MNYGIVRRNSRRASRSDPQKCALLCVRVVIGNTLNRE